MSKSVQFQKLLLAVAAVLTLFMTVAPTADASKVSSEKSTSSEVDESSFQNSSIEQQTAARIEKAW